jgi:tetraacyldisaccharide 4'-kinase
VPLDLIFAAVAASRREWFERHPEARYRLRRPVISVGNLSTGGTGKTPLVAQIATWLIERGERPAILSRGYRRRTVRDGVVVVSDGRSVLTTVDEAGDEPLMLARQVPGAIVSVCEDRHLAGVVSERALGTTVHLLDDGFQHLQLARDFDILVTWPKEITSGRVLPRGRLREGPDAASRAHFAVVVGADYDSARTEAWELGISAFSAARRRITFASAAAAGPAVAVAGIAQPEQFFAMLRDAGVPLRATLAFGDHHRYTSADVERIKTSLNDAQTSTVLTTSKDAVRFEALGKMPFDVAPVPMNLELDDWSGLTASIEQALHRARSRE